LDSAFGRRTHHTIRSGDEGGPEVSELSPEVLAAREERWRTYNEERMRELETLMAADVAAVRAQEIHITPEERAAMGECGKKLRRKFNASADEASRQFADQINDYLRDERDRARSDRSDPLIAARAIFAAHKTLLILVEHGFPQLKPALAEMLIGVDAIARLFRKELCRRLLLDQIDEAKAAAAVAELGRWPDWKTHLDEVAAAIQWA
jgi:hypothetical protein